MSRRANALKPPRSPLPHVVALAVAKKQLPR